MRDNRDWPKRKGRPRWNGERDSKCDVRLNAEENDMLNELAERNEVTRSTIMRKALKDFYKFNTED